MTIVKNTIQYLNPGQVPVIAADQPLYAPAKQVQWTWPEEFGEEKFVVMFEGLHIELAALKLSEMFFKTADGHLLSYRQISHHQVQLILSSKISRTRHAHQVTAASLFVLMKTQYEAYIETENRIFF